MNPPPGPSEFNPETCRYEANGCYWDGKNWKAIDGSTSVVAPTTWLSKHWKAIDGSPSVVASTTWLSKHWVVLVAGVGVLAVGIGIGMLSAGGGGSEAAQEQLGTTRSMPTNTLERTQENSDALSESAAAVQSSRVEASARQQAQASAQQAARAAEDNARAAQAQQAAAEAQRTKFDRGSYPAVSEREYELLVRDPKVSQGRRMVVHGHVIQFDTITGATMFRAETAGVPGSEWYDFDINTIVNFDSVTAGDVVEGDIVTMYVEVVGVQSYTTTFGAKETAPVLKANIVDVIG